MDSSSPSTRTGYRLKFYDALPLMTAGLILVLYALAFLRAMEYIWLILAGIVVCIVVRFFIYIFKGKRSAIDISAAFYSLIPRADTLVAFIFFIILCAVMAYLTKGHVVKWWDDLNFWATDAKALYYLNGFTGKYGNVAPEFGDYPPAIQIAKWCALKVSANEYREGYAFVGYSLMNMIFLLPLMKVSDKVTSYINKGVIVSALLNVVWMAVIMLIPGIVNDVWSYGACADVTMGIVYGAMLMAIYETLDCEGGRINRIAYLKIALYGSVTALCKNTGFMWVTFALILLIVLTLKVGMKKRYAVLTVLTVYLVQGSWWANCIINRRIAKLTGALARTATGGMSMPEDASDKLRYYLLGFIKEPMHTAHTPFLDISAFMMFVILILMSAMTIILIRKNKTESHRIHIYRVLTAYTVITGIAIYVIVLLSHMSIFATETQYGSSEVMAISISRYGAPFTIGTFMLLVSVIFGRKLSDRRVIISFAAAVLLIILTTDYPAYSYMLKGYEADRETDISARAEMIDLEGQQYIDYINSMDNEEYDAVKGHRILFLRDGSRIHWVNDTYINYEVAPMATVYASYDEGMSNDELREIIDASHAEYVYRDGRLDEVIR